jgi:iron complex outermembrane recepter protein
MKPIRNSTLWLFTAAKVFLLLIFTFLVDLGSPAFASDSARGIIAGHVANAATGRLLEGATVEIPSLSLQTLTDMTGAFIFLDMPAGAHTVVVSYTGLDQLRETVEVARGQRVSHQFDLTSQVYQLGTLVVTGEREGNAASITRQHNAANVVNVVSMDAYGNVADGNIGNFMKRLPGISTIEQNGDVIGIGIRGTPPAWNAVNIDGTRASSAVTRLGAQGDRATVIDQVPSEFVKEVEVQKALTPDQAADSIGGAINLVTKSPLDFKEPVFTYRAGFNFNTYRDGMDWNAFRPTASFSYLTPLGKEGKFGIAVTGSYSETLNPREVLRMERILADGRNTSTRMQTVTNARVRAGGSVKLDYRPDEMTSILLTFSTSYYSGQQDWAEQQITASGARRVADYSRVSRAQIEAGAVPRDSANQAAGVAPGYTDAFTELLHANAQINFSYSTRYAHNNKVEASAQRQLGGGQTLSFKTSYNPSNYDYTNRRFFLDRTGGFGWAIDTTANRSRPIIRQTYGPSLVAGADLSIFTARLTDLPDNVDEDINRAQIEYEKKFSNLRIPVEFKAGGNWRNQKRDQTFRQPTWAFLGADGVAGTNPATGVNDDNLNQFRTDPGIGPFNGYYAPFNRVSLANLDRMLVSNPSYFRYSAPADTIQSIKEDVLSYFAMARARIQKLNIMGGVRREDTDVSANGRNSDPRNPNVTRAHRDGSYSETFPSIHFRYEQSRRLQFRASYSTGMTRPLLAQLFPATTVSYNDTTGLGQVSQANTDLKPQTSRNYDASVEYYLEPGGVISIGVFRKDVDDFIAADSVAIGSGANNGFNGQYSGFTLVTTRNFGSARIEGYEINYNQRLTMLPRPFDGLAIFANYTHLKTSGTYSDGAEELEGFVPKILNAGIYYSWKRVELRAAYNHMGRYLSTYSSDVLQRIRQTPVETWDFNAQYRLSSRVTLFGDVLNAFDKRSSQYTAGDPNRIMNVEAYGPRFSVGVSGRF